MTGMATNVAVKHAHRVRARSLALGLALFFLASPALAQNDSAQAPDPNAAPAETQPANRGLFGTIGRWIDGSIAGVTSGWNTTRNTLGDWGGEATGTAVGAAGAARDTATTIVRLPMTSIVAGRELCVRAPNGGPDCRTATAYLCRGRGYAAGTSLDIQSEHNCPASVWLSAREPNDDECTIDTFVTRAVCQ